MSKEIGEEYASSLSDLTVNSKPLINMLTILAEENVEHAGVIVQAVEKHLEKVRPEIKLPVLYLIDSIIKNVGGAYTEKFSQIISKIFTKTFREVDEKIRSQMFKLRETWHDVLPAVKLYHLDVKVHCVDPAWPIQAQPPQSNIHVNPNFLKKPVATSSMATVFDTSQLSPVLSEEEMKNALVIKEKELQLLKRTKVEMKIEQARRQMAENKMILDKIAQKSPLESHVTPGVLASLHAEGAAAPVNSVAVVPPTPAINAVHPPNVNSAVSAKQRLGPPISSGTRSPAASGTAKIAPVSKVLASARRVDPRLARHQPSPPVATPAITRPHIAPIVFDIRPTERVVKRKNAISIDVQPDSVRKPHSAHKARDPRRRDPRLLEKRTKNKDNRTEVTDQLEPKEIESNHLPKEPKNLMIPFPVADPKKIYKLPPIPKINYSKQDEPSPTKNSEKCDGGAPLPVKRRRDHANNPRIEKKLKKRDSKDSSGSSSPDKKSKGSACKEGRTNGKPKGKDQLIELNNFDKPSEEEIVAFKELKNFHKDRYMRRNKEKSESPEKIVPIPVEPVLSQGDAVVSTTIPSEPEATNLPDVVVDNKDIDLRLLHTPAPVTPAPASVAKKRPSTETLEGKPVKKNKLEKFDILFGNEDVDLRQLPQVEEVKAPPPPIISTSECGSTEEPTVETVMSPIGSPKEHAWSEVKVPKTPDDAYSKKIPTQLDMVRAKLAEATKGTDRLGRPFLFHKSVDGTPDRRRTISATEDTDMRTSQNSSEPDTENDKEAIKTIMSQAVEQFKGGNMNENQYNMLVVQVLQLNERQKLKEAKQRESLEASKRKLLKLSNKDLNTTPISDDEFNVSSPNSPKQDHSATTAFGDIDERVAPPPHIVREQAALEPPIMNIVNSQPDIPMPSTKDSDLRVPPVGPFPPEGMPAEFLGPNAFVSNIGVPGPPRQPMVPNMPPMFMGPFPHMWRGHRPRMEDFNGPRGLRGRGPMRPFFRNKFDNRMPFDRPPFEPPMMPMLKLPVPLLGLCQGESPLKPYVRSKSPPPLGADDQEIPPTDHGLLEYVEKDPMKTIMIDGIAREIRFYDKTAIVMLDWDDPREIKFLPGTRRVTFDAKDSVVLGLNEDYTEVEVDEQTFKIRLGAPTRELYINNRWFECYFGGPPVGIIIDEKIKLVHLEGPLPEVSIGKEKRTDLIAGKINIIVDGSQICPIFLDAKLQRFEIQGVPLTVRFVDSLRTVLINEQPFAVDFGGLPRPIFIGRKKHFIRFPAIPKNVKPGQVIIANMEGELLQAKPTIKSVETLNDDSVESEKPKDELKVDLELENTEAENSTPGGLDMLANLMPSSMAPASQFSGYTLAEPLQPQKSTGVIPGLDTPVDENPPPTTSLPFFGNINVTDLFAKLVASGIVQVPSADTTKPEEKENVIPKQITPEKPAREDKRTIKRVDLLKPETLRVKQPGVVARLYGGMQCSGCGARFPPEHTVRYSQHLDWHFRQNRRERDSARRAHSRHWHYDLSDWVQYEEIEDLEEREKSWFESQGAAGKASEGEAPPDPCEQEALSVPAGAPHDQFCALCGDKFDQFYNEDKEEWHLRKAVCHENKNYHPLCFEDYKTSLTKEEPPVEEANDSVVEVIVPPEKVEHIDLEVEEVNSQSDNESVVEVIESESQPEDVSQEPLIVEEEEEGDEDDVVLKAEPVEEVVVRDDEDTDDETTAERAARDVKHDLDFSHIRVKQEPVDPDDEPIITAEEELETTRADTTHTTVLSSIDGNVQLESTQQGASTLPLGGIRINITKPIPIPTLISKETDSVFDDISADDEPLPPGEEPELVYTIKPSLQNVQLSRQPPVQRDKELSGLCSIM